MGCGALCSDPQSPSSPVLSSLPSLLASLKPSSHFLPSQKHKQFMKTQYNYPGIYHLEVTAKISAGQVVSDHILEKWKFIIYGVDNDDTNFYNCLGFNQKWLENGYRLSKNLAGYEQDKIHQLMDIELENKNSKIYYHQKFEQIGKDIDRTFPLSPSKKKQFQKILKRITNHFPTMGYTQGINFIIAFLLLIGYSQADTFWIFVHLALNKRFMLLGLYEDRFPLSRMYIQIFRNMIQRLNGKLHHHLFEQIQAIDEIWIFQWFTTYYLYSFPLEMSKYVWNLAIEVGGLGIVSFAVSLTLELQSKLLEIDDLCEFSSFFQQMQCLETFNSRVNIKRVIERAYKLKPEKGDLQNVNSESFYSQYMKQTVNNNVQNDGSKKSTELLNNWYVQILADRKKFHQNKQREEENQIQKIQRFKQVSTAPQEIEKSMSPRKQESFDIKLPLETNQKKAGKRKFRSHFIEEQQQLQEENYDDFSQLSQELDKYNSKINIRCKVDNQQFNYKENIPRQNIKRQRIPPPKRNNFGINIKQKSTFVSAGQSILNKFQLKDSSQQSKSVSSKNTINYRKQNRTVKEGTITRIPRICGCKTKTQQNKISADKNSERQQTLSKHTDELIRSIQEQDIYESQIALENTKSQRQIIDAKTIINNNSYHNYIDKNNRIDDSSCQRAKKQSIPDGVEIKVADIFKKNKMQIEKKFSEAPIRDNVRISEKQRAQQQDSCSEIIYISEIKNTHLKSDVSSKNFEKVQIESVK